jgi:CubicO group peptidase (beta-lactamase class C family)
MSSIKANFSLFSAPLRLCASALIPDLLFCASLASLAVGCAPLVPPSAAQVFSEGDRAPVFTDPERRKKLESAFPAIDALVDGEVRDHGLAGLAVGVVIDGELAHARGAGFANVETKAVPDADTVFRIGSITKSFTGLAILALRDDGALALDDPLTRFVPEAAGLVYPTRDAPPITIRQLLTHTSGLPRLGKFDYTRADREPSEDEIVRSLADFKLENAPGTAHVYSNLGFSLLGIAAGRAAHMTLRQLLATRVFAPLGMTRTAFDPSVLPSDRLAVGYEKNPLLGFVKVALWRMGASEGAGGIYSTVRDMARYVAFQLAAYPPRSAADAGPVRRSSVREAHFTALKDTTLNVTLRDDPVKGESLVAARSASYGYGWVIEDGCELDDYVWHNGAIEGFQSAIGFLAQRGVGVVALTNVKSPGFDGRGFIEKVLVLLQKTGGLANRAKPAVLPPEFGPAMTRFLGVYNAWDEVAYKAMLSPTRGQVTAEEERKELAGYRSFHGACSGYDALEILGPRAARLRMRCERGSLDMAIDLDAKGLIGGFAGTSHNVPPPPAVARAAARVAGLITKWDEEVYRTLLGPSATDAREKYVADAERLRAAHGSCAVGSYVRTNDWQRFVLTCERGSDLELTLELDPKNEDVVTKAAIKPRDAGGRCPVKK